MSEAVAPPLAAEFPDDTTRPVRVALVPAIRAGIALAGAIAAITVWFAGAPAAGSEDFTAASHSSDIAAVRSTQDTNEILADSSPQQTVVNTWATVDMLNVVADQLDAMADLEAEIATVNAATAADSVDSRVPALILIAVLVGCFTLAVQPRAMTRTRVTASSSPVHATVPSPSLQSEE